MVGCDHGPGGKTVARNPWLMKGRSTCFVSDVALEGKKIRVERLVEVSDGFSRLAGLLRLRRVLPYRKQRLTALVKGKGI